MSLEYLALKKKKKLVSFRAPKAQTGGFPERIGEQFFNELTKREIGRLACKANNCTHFMSLDADEYYLHSQLSNIKNLILENDYHATACRMRIFFKEPIYELYPHDNINAVPLIYKILEGSEFKLATPYPIIFDPTRGPENISFDRFHLFPRNIIEMYHMSFVRKNIRMKMENVSNRANYEKIEDFIQKFEHWKPEMGIIHPHSCIGKLFSETKIVPNYFNINLPSLCDYCYKSNTKRCSRCLKARYCSRSCQASAWPSHKKICTATQQ